MSFRVDIIPSITTLYLDAVLFDIVFGGHGGKNVAIIFFGFSMVRRSRVCTPPINNDLLRILGK